MSSVATSAVNNNNNNNARRNSATMLSRQSSSAGSSSIDSSSLTPSQTIRSGNNKKNKKNKQKPDNTTTTTTTNGDAKQAPTTTIPAAENNTNNANAPPVAEADNKNNNNNNSQKKNANQRSRQRRRNTNHKKKDKTTTTENSNETTTAVDSKPPAATDAAATAANNTNATKKKRHHRRKKNTQQHRHNDAKRYPWRACIPEHAVDPITLEPLDELLYPPFALAAHEPYTPVPEWPVMAKTDNNMSPQQLEEERQRRILQEQWGQALARNKKDSNNNNNNDTQEEKDADETVATTTTDPKERHYNLYDGRALAYYMVQQLQFIDPLNRRDLTRDELLNLDHYLRRHGFVHLNVTEAYDAKGITLSTAGAAAHTAAGRAQMLQQEANVLLQALFQGASVTAVRGNSNTNTNTNSLARQYQSYAQQQQHPPRQQQQQQSSATVFPDTVDHGIYGDLGGILVIDDDMNPGLRGDAPVFEPSSSTTGTQSGSLWSASHIASRHNHAARLQAQEFPSLAATAEPATPQQPLKKKNHLPKAKTLAKISGVVKQTTEEEKQKQWEAREAMKRKAALSNLTFGSNVVALNSNLQQPSMSATVAPATTTTTTTQQPTEGQIERNKALADALGVVPATMRRQESLNSGWARITDPLKEFGEELQATIYPDSIIMQARERMGLVLKMEKKWKTFLEDDKASSLPLTPMDRPTRTFVHHYSDFWNLNTESYDPEPRRYIQCSKTRETMAPYPLLSVAARNWTGPRIAPLPTAPQAVRSVPDPPLQRQPLSLKTSHVVAATSADVTTTVSAAERPKLQLQPRTAPLELPPPPPPEPSFDAREALRMQQERMQEKARQDQEMLKAKRKALESAFASDSEDDDGDNRSSASWDSDEWVEQEPLYKGDDE
uniref:R3H domain-containing protein n=1 Tax=Amphora coffeiformis TaxID=265554 RepID=A0A7S3L575_9STRA